MFDAHCHLDFSWFDSDRDDVVNRAYDEGIGIITCAVDVEGINKTLNFSNKFSQSKRFFMTFGIPPTNFDENKIKEFVNIVETHKDKIIGLGEIGLDYYWIKDENAKENQRRNFKNFIELSKKLNKKMIIHSRNAEKDVVEILKESGSKAMLHCFSGSIEQASEAIDFGCIISVPTSAYYSKERQKMLAQIPTEYLVTETDAPFLSPFPKVRNEPFNIKYLIQKIAEIKNLGVQKVSDITEENLKNFFKF
ncbi:MAG: TatD family hydrolase [Candidatus Altiarchaeum hamiconexum]|uniref:TatD family hydrolase n=1 Tax=Candidatus Altarchaeum hamiconexum TaxID=1803513 RepID=A0A8J8CF46_9ARCH|nr:TatD family hydrolase [Candidatus Altarchaeum hamiconexum]OIQ06177.1 MAG: hypothetical protein AUK59_00805 [Candidatus Altarchaeum sp. CG2_30_32_3053]PIN67413.1 MAG: hypothetical protein COV98_02970 [Candidatus Altarchaeum sp. CG12_big_fil_rev_8_21_14_0_65_33_22]PIV28411.1 MAG: hypothetical protein COS36_02355 [Candidatus Altarchaeum sp. CG03_land_8_20_14_0_80_32_618]PIZ29298.1 MAG: hypothetical protein COY41_05970 [Candidatus Altarchaeum sp. CG_4_10_14_0_8_um_filter_32_851]PJC15649.1 MAG: 